MRRRKLNRKANRRIFRKGTRIKSKNLRANVMRGGFRL